jgi:energy-coupling factor transport system substrate-specific component
MKIKDIAIIGMLSAILISVQVGLASLPNIELVSLLIIVYTLVLKKKTIYVITVFILLEGFLYGIGTWWLNYLYIWFVLYIITILFSKERSSLIWAIISGVYGLSFGALCAIPYIFIGTVSNSSFLGGLQMAFAYWINGIPYDIPHGIGNFFAAFVLVNPLRNLLSKLIKSDLQTI